MSCCEASGINETIPGTGCCGSSCSSGKRGCLASEPRIRSCSCQENVGCIDRSDCGGFRPRGTAATGACPGPCQCAEEDAWNINIPPKPNCEWLSNFSELRRQWSDHSRQQNCKCCNCQSCRKAAPCKPCLTNTSSYSDNPQSSSRDGQVYGKERLAGGGSSARTNNSSSRGSPPNYNSQNHNFESHSSPHSSPHSAENTRCQPCSPSQRSILKKRSCCQCVSGYCMCQPMPRNCNCPPPVQVDARAEKECSCDCPSSPECACPPSERRFARTKIRCPNAKMCTPLPRLPPGPKCLCSECQPCLPPPCDHCTSTKCKTISPKMVPCQADSNRRPVSSTKSSRSYRHQSESAPYTSCQKMPSTYHDNNDEALQSRVRGINRPRSSHSRPGQSLGPDDAIRDGDEDGVATDEKFRLCNQKGKPTSSVANGRIISEEDCRCCSTGFETVVQRDQEFCESPSNFTTQNSFVCPVCLSLMSSNTCCQEEKALEFDREFEEKSDQVDSSFYCAEESKADRVCEQQIEESFNNCKNNKQFTEWEEEKNISEIESALEINERDEDECIDQFEDNVQYFTDYDPSTLSNETVLESTAIFKCEEQLECSQKQTCNNSIVKAEINPCHQKISSEEENLLIKNKISTSSINERQDPVDSSTDITICFNNNRKTSKTILLKSEDQFYPKNRKTASCNCKVEPKNKEPEPKTRSSRKNSFYYKDTSFFDGWNNLKNALGSYFYNRISLNSSKSEEKREYKFCSSSAEESERERREIRRIDLNDKERRDVGTQNSQPRGDIYFKITNINRLDSFRNSRKNFNHTKRSNMESTESKAVHSKDKIQKHNKDSTSIASDCTISWSLDRALINIQPENNEDMILNVNMQPKDNNNDNMGILNSADSLFPDDSTVIRDEDKVNYAIDVTNDNLSESSSNECLVHPRKDNCISECKFRRNENDQRVGSEELKQQKNNFHNGSTSGFDEMRKKEDLMQRRNFFQGIKFTTSKIQNH